LVKLFELSVSALVASEQTQTSYKTTLKAFDAIRLSILEDLAKTDDVLRGEIEADEAYFGGKRKGNRGRGARNKTIVFGILERNGKVSVDIVRDVSAKTLLSNTIKKVRKGSIVYTDKWRGYDSLVFSGYKHLSIDHQKIFAKGKVYINGIEGFWSFVKERMAKYHGVSPGKFLLYIKEMEWRYNNRDEDTFSLLVDYILGEDN
jgi:transposase